MKFLSLKVLAIVGMLSLSTSAMAADYTLSVNTALTAEDPLFTGLEAFRDAVAERTKGAIEIRLYPNSQLGSDEDVIEQARSGAPVAALTDGGRLALLQKEFGVLGAPYLTSSYDDIRKIVTSDLFKDWAVKLRGVSGLEILSFNWWQGVRHMWTNKPVTKPADLAGVRVRTPGAPIWTETVKAIGATPTPMPYAETYSALQQNVIDAVEIQYPAGWGSKLYEVTTHIAKTGHFSLITGLVVSGTWLDSLPQEFQTILREEALRAGDVASAATGASLVELEEKLKATGILVSEIDVTPFREATMGVYKTLGYAELRDELQMILQQ